MKDTSAYSARYKYKLNMLESGTQMLKCIGIMLILGGIFYICNLKALSFFVWGLSGSLFLILIILLIIEAHQDKVLNEIAKQENDEMNHSSHLLR